MKLEDEIKQPRFKDAHHRALINIIFTGSWLEMGISQVLKEFGLSNQQYNVLRILRGSYPDPLNLQDIQSRMMDKMSNATRLVEKLRQKRLLTRNQCPTNRRKVEIEITDKGLTLLAQLDPVIAANQKQMTKKLTKEEAGVLNKLLDKLRK